MKSLGRDQTLLVFMLLGICSLFFLGATHHQTSQTVRAKELRIVGENGETRILLSVKKAEEAASIELFDKTNNALATLTVADNGIRTRYSSLRLAQIGLSGPDKLSGEVEISAGGLFDANLLLPSIDIFGQSISGDVHKLTYNTHPYGNYSSLTVSSADKQKNAYGISMLYTDSEEEASLNLGNSKGYSVSQFASGKSAGDVFIGDESKIASVISNELKGAAFIDIQAENESKFTMGMANEQVLNFQSLTPQQALRRDANIAFSIFSGLMTAKDLVEQSEESRSK